MAALAVLAYGIALLALMAYWPKGLLPAILTYVWIRSMRGGGEP